MIRQLPPAPSRDRPNEFSGEMDVFLASMQGFADDANALEQAMELVATTGTSTTSMTVGVGSKSLTTAPGKAWATGAWVYVFAAAAVSNYMVGRVTSYDVDTGALVVNVSAIDGSGTHSSWIIGLATPVADGHLVARDGSRAMTAELMLSGNAANALGAVPKQQAEAIADAVWPVGAILAVADLSPPSARWLLVDGKTIGNASSGASARANADTEALFTKLWAFPAASVPIYTSAGSASTRGASAAADFAAGKRIALFTPDGGAFLRMWAPGQTKDPGRAAGSVQLDAFQGHWHNARTTGNVTQPGDPAIEDGARTGISNSVVIDPISDGINGEPRTASETRPYNLSMPHYIKL